jgi:predicted RNA binding protein YcfA (HicA-like mRNA interferase family)
LGLTVTREKYLPQVKVRDVIRLIEADGWRLDRQRGSHRQFRHPEKPGTVTIAGKPSAELKTGTLSSILRQADMPRSTR